VVAQACVQYIHCHSARLCGADEITLLGRKSRAVVLNKPRTTLQGYSFSLGSGKVWDSNNRMKNGVRDKYDEVFYIGSKC